MTRARKGECRIEGCTTAVNGLGMCNSHYRFTRLYGTPFPRPLPASEVQRLRTLVGVPAGGPTEEQRQRWLRDERGRA